MTFQPSKNLPLNPSLENLAYPQKSLVYINVLTFTEEFSSNDMDEGTPIVTKDSKNLSNFQEHHETSPTILMKQVSKSKFHSPNMSGLLMKNMKHKNATNQHAASSKNSKVNNPSPNRKIMSYDNSIGGIKSRNILQNSSHLKQSKSGISPQRLTQQQYKTHQSQVNAINYAKVKRKLELSTSKSTAHIIKHDKHIKSLNASRTQLHRSPNASRIMNIIRGKNQDPSYERSPIIATEVPEDEIYVYKTMRQTLDPPKYQQLSSKKSMVYQSMRDSNIRPYTTNASNKQPMKKQTSINSSVVQRMWEDDQRRREKMRQLEAQKRDKELKEEQNLPFRPQILQSGEFKKRDFTEFYQDQISFKHKIENSISQKIEHQFLTEYMTAKHAHVKANKKSDLLLQKHQSTRDFEKVHIRLHNNESLVQTKKKPQQNVLTLKKPKAKAGNQKQTMNRLFSEGRKREEKLKELQSKWEDLSKFTAGGCTSASKDINNRMMLEKLRKDFCIFFNKDMFFPQLKTHANEVNQLQEKHQSLFKEFSRQSLLKSCGDMSPSKNLQEQLTKGTPIKLKNYIKIMHVLGFMSLRGQTSQEEDQITQIWKILGGTQENQVKAENLFILLAGILNIQLPDLIIDHSNLTEPHVKQQYLCYDSYHNAHFSVVEDIIKLNQKYMQIAINRKQTSTALKRDHSNDSQKFTFKPQIGLQSKSKPNLNKQSGYSESYNSRQQQLTAHQRMMTSELRGSIKYSASSRQESLIYSEEVSMTRKKASSDWQNTDKVIMIDEPLKSYTPVSPRRMSTFGQAIKPLEVSDASMEEVVQGCEQPVLTIDVNMGKEKGIKKIVLFESDDPRELADRFAQEEGIPDSKREKLEVLIRQKLEEHRKKRLIQEL